VQRHEGEAAQRQHDGGAGAHLQDRTKIGKTVLQEQHRPSHIVAEEVW
jgi:hypothetical protein